MATVEIQQQSALRIRIGVFFLLLWWLPVWALAPALSDVLGVSSAAGRHRVFIGLIIIQTVIGLLGLLIASRQVVALVKQLPRKKVPGAFWHILWTGKTDNLKPTEKS